MIARVERGRIFISFPEDADAGEVGDMHAQISDRIASARENPDNLQEVSCALSTTNFRKLREMGCKLADDSFTRECVAKLRARMDQYHNESRRLAAAREDKSGALAVPYEFKRPPRAHQIVGFNGMHAALCPGLFGDCGTGKTMIVSTFADSLIKNGAKVAFLVVCPVNLIEHAWIEDIRKFTDLTALSLRTEIKRSYINEDFDEKGDPRDPAQRAALRDARRKDPVWRKKAKARSTKRHNQILQQHYEQHADVYVINPEAARTPLGERRLLKLVQHILAGGRSLRLVIDESSKLKSRTSAIYKTLKKIRTFCEGCIIMTGTPSPNGLIDLWAQFSVLDDGLTLQPSFADYRADVCREIELRGISWTDKSGRKRTATKWEPRPGAALQVYKLLEPRVLRFRIQDCVDLPPKQFIIREVEMSAEQAEVYEAMEDRLFAEIDGETITARVAASKLIKLREVTGGFIITDAGDERPIGKESPKMLELDELLEQSIADKLGDEGVPNKAIVWAQYQWECKELVKRYAKYGARGLFGGISQKDKDDAIRRFKSDPKARLLVCHPASVGHGLTLTEANYVFYYSLSYNFEEFYQSHARNARIGQTRAMTFYFLVCPKTLDEELLDAIRAKKDLSDLVTDGRRIRNQIFERRAKPRPQVEFDPAWIEPASSSQLPPGGADSHRPAVEGDDGD